MLRQGNFKIFVLEMKIVKEKKCEIRSNLTFPVLKERYTLCQITHCKNLKQIEFAHSCI